MFDVSCRCNGRFDLGQWVRFAHKILNSPTTDRSRGRHPRLRPLNRVCRSDITVAGSPGPKLPLHATSENAANCLPAPRCIRATLFGKVDDLQFAPFRGHILTRIIRPSRAWLCGMAQVEPLE